MVISARTTRNGENVRPLRGVAIGRGTVMTGAISRWLAALAPPLGEDLVRVEPEVERVVAQEALRVDVAGELLPVAALQRGEIAGPDLRVALGAVQVDALALARRVEPLGQAQDRLGGRRRRLGALAADGAAELVACRHRLVLVRIVGARSPVGAAGSRRSTWRAFEPSNAPM